MRLEIRHLGGGLSAPLQCRRRLRGGAPARRRRGRRGFHQDQPARRHRHLVWAGGAIHLRRGAAGRPQFHSRARRRRSRCRKPISKRAWRARSASIPTSGSSRSRIAPGAISSTAIVVALAPLFAAGLDVRGLHDAAAIRAIARRRRQRAGVATLVVPMHRLVRAAATGRRLAARSSACARPAAGVSSS